jgi:hypothetical protein
MKRFSKDVNIYDSETLQLIGSFPGKRVAIIGEHEHVPDIWSHIWYWVAAAVGIIILIIVTVKVNMDNTMLRSEIADYREDLDAALSTNNEATAYYLIGKCLMDPTKEPAPEDRTLIYETTKELGAWYPEVIMAQCVLESACGTSAVGRRDNNMYGMKKVSSRVTTQVGSDRSGYGVYRNWKHSIIDRILWDRYNWNEKPAKLQYMTRIQSVYAEDPNYLGKLNRESSRWLNQ